MSTLTDRYFGLVRTGLLLEDDRQLEIIAELGRLADELVATRKQKTNGLLARLFGNDKATVPIRGIYIWGDVGRGKTMLMDLFFDNLQIEKKHRDHFLSFMQSVHSEIHAFRQKQKAGEIWEDADPVRLTAQSIATKTKVLCFDEFQVGDITDAMILGRLFDALFEHGVTVIATSNRCPDELYKDGLNRHAFLPFIKLFKQQMRVISLDSQKDYRLNKLAGSKLYYCPLDEEAAYAIQTRWEELTELKTGKPESLVVRGHELVIPAAARGVARFDFADLCDKPLAGGDYIAIAGAYRTVIIENIPVIRADQRNVIKRFIALVDVFYDRGIKLIVSAQEIPRKLYVEGPAVFEFDRTISRLMEMQSVEYWEQNSSPTK